MKIVEPSVEYLPQIDPIDHVAHCGHICYASPDKGHEANEKFYNNLVKSKHLSVLRHETHYYLVPTDEVTDSILVYSSSPYIGMQWVSIMNDLTGPKKKYLCIAANGQFILEHALLKEQITPHEVSMEEFKKLASRLCRYTMCCTTSIDITREFNRVSPNSITEESTRYCNYSKDKFGNEISCVRPSFVHTKVGEIDEVDKVWSEAMNKAQDYYFKLLELGWKPEQARKVLPLATKSTVIYTYSIEEWESILQKRLLNMTGKAHPDAIKLAELIYLELQKLGYKLDENGNLNYAK